MKKLFTLIILLVVGFTANAAKVNVAISNNSFTSNNFTINIGDTIRWTLAQGTHNVTGTTLPGGAATISSGTLSTQGSFYEYKVTVLGDYTYRCTFHGGMNGAFTVVDPTASISKIQKTVESKVYPNPFTSKVTIVHNTADKIEICTLLGETVKTFSVSSNDKTSVLDLSELRSGVYFYVVKLDNKTLETRRIIKSEQ